MSKKKTLKLPALQGRAEAVPNSFNRKKRTVDVVFATETPVRTYYYEYGYVNEILSIDKDHMRMGRLANGAPVLDNHNRYEGAKGVLGSVRNPRIENGEAVATLKFSRKTSVDEILNDIEDGHLNGVSVGYKIHSAEITEVDGEIPTVRAIDWEALEISLAPIQADENSSIRKNNPKEFGEVEIIDVPLQTNRATSSQNSENSENQNKTKMEEKERKRLAELERKEKERNDAALLAEQERKAKEEANKLVIAERKRVKSINEMCRKFNVDADIAQGFIDNESTLDQVRTAIIEDFEGADPNSGQRGVSGQSITFGEDDSDKFQRAAVESLEMRVGGVREAKHGGDSFRGMNMKDLAVETLSRAGVSTKGMTPNEIFKMAVNGQRSSMGTSDFGNILGNAVNRRLTKAYEESERTFLTWASRGVAKDFREMNRVSISGVNESFKEVKEGGEYESATLTDGVETYKVAKYGQIIPFTWEMMVNDDLSALDRLPRIIANKATQKQSDLVYAILTGNPVMADGDALFHANHGNLGTAGDISDSSLKEMKKKFRTQKSVSGDFINVRPKFLIVGSEMENTALKFMNSNFSPTKVADQNIYQGIMDVVVEPRIENFNWFAAANPALIDTVEYSFLEGEGELHTEQAQGFEVDGVKTKARMTFGAKALDHRGLFKNAYTGS